MAIIRLKESAFPAFGVGKGTGSEVFNMFQNEMNRLFNNFLSSSGQSPASGVYPPVNIYQTGENIYVTAELPGVESQDISIEVEEDGLQIRGDRKIGPESDGFYHRKERECGKFSRKITFRNRVAVDKVVAELVDGVLTITLPKAQDAKPKKISVVNG